jgi:hypothetical protein
MAKNSNTETIYKDDKKGQDAFAAWLIAQAKKDAKAAADAAKKMEDARK